MAWLIVGHVVALLVDLVVGGWRVADEKDLELALLRHQLRILQYQRGRPPRLARWEKLTLAVLTANLAGLVTKRGALRRSVLLFQPETVLRWHRELLRRKWAFRRSPAVGRPPLAADLAALVRRLAAENGRWGYSRIHGELRKLGYTISRSAVRDVLTDEVGCQASCETSFKPGVGCGPAGPHPTPGPCPRAGRRGPIG